MRTPRRRNVARFCCVASCCHILTFMAGATMTGAVVARYKVERKSEAVPLANLAIVSAVAGATSNASIDCATPICSTEEPEVPADAPSANISVMTFFPESAAKVSGRTNSCAARVITTCTSTPRSCNSTKNLSRLVSGNSSGYAQCDLHGFSTGADTDGRPHPERTENRFQTIRCGSRLHESAGLPAAHA